MDNLSSPASIPSPTVTTPSPVTKQPTYTTAGTLWNPSTAQPLQAPARRGRSFKWAVGGPHSDLALLPKSVLASLPLKTNLSRAPSFQRYSPLQQNYDRAVSPFSDRDHQLATMSPQTPRMRSGNAPAPLASLLSQLDKDKLGEENASEGDDEAEDGDDDDDDSDFNMNPLLNMTVKSLNNLASYPNPNQRRAQKALYGWMKPTMTVQTSATRASTPSSPPFNRIASPGHLKNGRGFTPMLPTTQSDSSLLRQRQTNFGVRPDACRPMDGQKDSTTGSDERPDILSPPMMHIPGPGAPRPLTAGPPGQRQYRPSTFEATFKALQNTTNVQAHATEDEDAVTIARQTMLQAGIDDADLVTDAFPSPLGIYLAPSPGPLASSSLHKTPSLVMDHRDSGLSCQTSDASFTSAGTNGTETNRLQYNAWYNSRPCSVGRRSLKFETSEKFKPGTDRLTDAALLARNQRIEKYWYEGVDMLGKTTDEVLAEARQRKTAQKLGAIGDGRPQKPRDHYQPIVIEEANRMSVAEHAKPLLNMAFATLLRSLEDDGFYQRRHSGQSAGVAETSY